MGSSPSADPRLIMACAMIQVVAAPAAYLTKGSFVPMATRIPA